MSRAGKIITATLLACSIWIGCGDEEPPCAAEGVIVSGVGVGTGGHAVCLGEGGAALVSRLGAATRIEDLGVLGQRLTYDALKVTLLLAGKTGAETLTAVYLGAGSTVKTAGGVGLGSSEAAVKAALGEPVKDPFVGAWWYAAKGISLQLEDGKVTAMQLTARVTK